MKREEILTPFGFEAQTRHRTPVWHAHFSLDNSQLTTMSGDPVSDKSAFLRMYMSHHPDTLVAYAKWYGKVQASIVSAEMTDISTKSMTLLCTLKSGEKQSTTVTFNPPLAGYDAVKPRLLEMKAIAQEHLGMIKAPHIASFEFPRPNYPPLVFTTALSFLNFFPETALAKHAINLLGLSNVQRAFQFTVAIHLLESLYTLYLCRKHKTGSVVSALYVASTVIFGYPIWVDLRKRIQKARIDSVMKVE
ncbi:hypothetical protein AX14_013998 [Amanita brunnescens Koide BX004]|nr:hypothetical protein AX14_013998 [Amanita brunnescens Koide BX004]